MSALGGGFDYPFGAMQTRAHTWVRPYARYGMIGGKIGTVGGGCRDETWPAISYECRRQDAFFDALLQLHV